MKKSMNILAATVLSLALLPTPTFASTLSVSNEVAKAGTTVPFQVVLNADSADMVKQGVMTISIEDGTFSSKELKAFLGEKDITKNVSVYEKSILWNVTAEDVVAIKKGDKINIQGMADMQGIGEKKLTVDANAIGLGVNTKAFATMTEEDTTFVKVLGKIPSVGYQSDSLKFAESVVVVNKGEELIATLPVGMTWNEKEMKKADSLKGATFVSVKKNVLVVKAGKQDTQVFIKPDVFIDENFSKGNVEVEFRSATRKASVVLAVAEEYKVTLSVRKGTKKEFVNTKEILVRVELKSTGGKLPKTSYVDFKLNGGVATVHALSAKETGDKAKITKEVDKFTFRTNDAGDTLELDLVVTPNKESKVVSLEAELKNASAKIDLVEVIVPVTVQASGKNIQGGHLDEDIGSLVIEEAIKGGFFRGSMYVLKFKDNKLNPVLFSEGMKVETKDMTIKDFALTKGEDAIQFMVDRTATSNKGMITISDLKVSTQKTIANGNYKGALYRAVEANKSKEDIVLNDGKHYGLEELTAFDWFSIGAEKMAKETIFTLGSKKYTVAGQGKELSTPVYTKDSYTMLPMRVVAETIGVDVAWDNTTKTATFTKGDVVVKVVSNKAVLNKNGTDIKMNTASENIKGSLFLPLSALGDVFGLERGQGYDWLPQTKQVMVRH